MKIENRLWKISIPYIFTYMYFVRFCCVSFLSCKIIHVYFVFASFTPCRLTTSGWFVAESWLLTRSLVTQLPIACPARVPSRPLTPSHPQWSTPRKRPPTRPSARKARSMRMCTATWSGSSRRESATWPCRHVLSRPSPPRGARPPSHPLVPAGRRCASRTGTRVSRPATPHWLPFQSLKGFTFAKR